MIGDDFKNKIIMKLFDCQQEAWVVERMGKFSRILNPGLNFLIPVIDQVKYVQSLKEIAIGKRNISCRCRRRHNLLNAKYL